MDITNEKPGKEAIMAVYASPNSENKYPERDCAEQGPHCVSSARGGLRRWFLSFQREGSGHAAQRDAPPHDRPVPVNVAA